MVVQLCFNMFNHSAFLVTDPDLPGQVAAAAEAGFDLFGPDIFSVDGWLAAGRSLEELAGLVADRGMRCWEVSGLDVTGPESLETARHVAEVAHGLGARWVLTNVSVPVDAAVSDCFGQACEILADGGAKAALEYLPFTPVNCIAAATELVDTVGPERAGILFDTWHHFRGPDTFAELEAAPLAPIAYVQFDDALPVVSDDLMAETLERRTFPGEGEFDLPRYCEIMVAKGFDGVVSVEILNRDWRHRDQNDFARRAYASTAALWSGS